jgi:hypothetical protein
VDAHPGAATRDAGRRGFDGEPGTGQAAAVTSVRRLRSLVPVVAVLLIAPLAASSARAQGSPAQWMERILDPGSIGVKPFPGSALQRKLSVDAIHLTEPPVEIAVYVAPLKQLREAAAYFERTLRVKPVVTGAGSEFERDVFELRGGGDYPKQAEGLRVTVMKSPWMDDKVEITMEWSPPAR